MNAPLLYIRAMGLGTVYSMIVYCCVFNDCLLLLISGTTKYLSMRMFIRISCVLGIWALNSRSPIRSDWKIWHPSDTLSPSLRSIRIRNIIKRLIVNTRNAQRLKEFWKSAHPDIIHLDISHPDHCHPDHCHPRTFANIGHLPPGQLPPGSLPP
jgi:hypothetical protein